MTAAAISRAVFGWGLVSGLLAMSPSVSRAEEAVDCKELDRKVQTLRETADSSSLPLGAHACEVLQSKIPATAAGATLAAPYPGWVDDLKECLKFKCYVFPNINTVVTKYCDIKDAPNECSALSSHGTSNPRPRWRVGLGGALIGVGALSIILGSVHLAVPLGYQQEGCIDHGLALPCTANRELTGAALITAGIVAGVGGILSLKLP